MWYKKEGGSVLKSCDIDKIQSVSMICSNRPLSYLPLPHHSLVLQSQAGLSRDAVTVLPIDHEDNNAGKQGGIDYYIFRIVQTDGKDHLLRSAKIDRVMKWINMIALVSIFASISLLSNFFFI